MLKAALPIFIGTPWGLGHAIEAQKLVDHQAPHFRLLFFSHVICGQRALELSTQNRMPCEGAKGRLHDGKFTIELPRLSYEVIDRELAEGRPVVAKIKLFRVVSHWVLIVAKDRDEYLVMDPLDRDTELAPLSERANSIEAIRVFHASHGLPHTVQLSDL
jgi:hypothetical protein